MGSVNFSTITFLEYTGKLRVTEMFGFKDAVAWEKVKSVAETSIDKYAGGGGNHYISYIHLHKLGGPKIIGQPDP